MARPKKPKKKSSRVFTNNQWNECYHQWLSSIGADSTREQYDGYARKFFADPKKSPDTYTRADVERFITSLTDNARSRGKPPAPHTRNDRLNVLCSFYGWCQEYLIMYRGKLAPILRGVPPTTGIKRAKVGEADRVMSDEEIERFFAVIPKNTLVGLRNRALFLAYFWTGRRNAEIVRLRWKDIEEVRFADGRIGWMYAWQGKGHVSRDDAAELPTPAVDAIKHFLEASGHMQLDTLGRVISCDLAPNDPLFPGLRPDAIAGQPISSDYVIQIFRGYAKAAGLPPERVVHSFRYAAAGERFEANGFDPLEVQRFLRHKNLNTTMRYLEPTQRKKRADPFVARLYDKWGHL